MNHRFTKPVFYYIIKALGGEKMKKQNIAIFALTASLLLSGCSLKTENPYNESEVQPVITTKQELANVYDQSLVISKIKAPSTVEEQDEIINYLTSLTGDNQVCIYEGTSFERKKMIEEEADPQDIRYQIEQDQDYSEEIFIQVLEQNPMLQIYYCGTREGESREQTISTLYPNVTYVASDQSAFDQIGKHFKANQVTSYCFSKIKDGEENLQDFDTEQTMKSIQDRFEDIDRASMIDGISNFCDYVESTTIYQKGEAFSNKVSENLKPYIEKAIPKVEQGVEKAGKLYENAKPNIEKAKEKIKSLWN